MQKLNNFSQTQSGFSIKMALNFVNKHGRGSFPKLGDEAMLTHQN